MGYIYDACPYKKKDVTTYIDYLIANPNAFTLDVTTYIDYLITNLDAFLVSIVVTFLHPEGCTLFLKHSHWM